MAYESALRFLTDHLAGDAYFRVSRPLHNLDRARAQLRVLEALDSGGLVARGIRFVGLAIAAAAGSCRHNGDAGGHSQDPTILVSISHGFL